jgi:hypothetical protein
VRSGGGRTRSIDAMRRNAVGVSQHQSSAGQQQRAATRHDTTHTARTGQASHMFCSRGRVRCAGRSTGATSTRPGCWSEP